MFRTVLIPCLLGAACLAHQTQQPQPAAIDPKKATVEGDVLNQVTKEPLKRVEVRLMRPDKSGAASPNGAAAYSVLTDAAGKFRFDDVEPGRYSVNYRKAGYVAGRRDGFGAMGGMRLVVVKASETHSGLRYYLVTQGIVTGRVLDAEDEPLQGVRVMLIRREYQRRMKRMVPHGQASTNDKGEYRIADVVPGQYYIQASVERGFSPIDASWGPAALPKPGEARMGYVSTYFPNASNQEQAVPVTVPPGQELPGQDIVLRREKVVRVVGKLVWPGGAPVGNVHVIYIPYETTYYSGGSSFATDEKGAFAINELRPGDYLLMAHSQTDAAGVQQQKMLQSVMRLHVGDRDIENVTVEWQPELEASGSFIPEGTGGKAVKLSGCTFSLIPVEFSLPVGSGGWAKSDGTFQLNQLLPIRLNPNAQCPGGSPYVKSIMVGDEDVLGKETDGATIAAAGITVIVRTDVASVSGTLDVPEEKKGAIGNPLVALLATDARLRDAGWNDYPAVDQEYRFQSKNLRPGEYLLLAFDEGDVTSLMDPQLYQLMESKGVKVTLGPSESKAVDLKLLAWPAELADRLQ